MVVAERHNTNDSSSSSTNSSSGASSTTTSNAAALNQSTTTTTTTNRRTRTLNHPNNANNSTTNTGNNNMSIDDDDDEDDDDSLDSDLDQQQCKKKYEYKISVGPNYQADISDTFQNGPAPREYAEKAVLVWTPYHNLNDDDLSDYIKLAFEKYKYNQEQALGILFWHEFNMKCALADLPNYAPYPDEWSMEDCALFEQAYQFHNKNFHKINQLLPDKKLPSIIKHYYTTKKNKNRVNSGSIGGATSYIDKQIRKNSQQPQQPQLKDENQDSMVLSDQQSAVGYQGNVLNNDDQQQQPQQSAAAAASNNRLLISNKDATAIKSNETIECVQCMSRNYRQYYRTKNGLFCKSCHLKRKKSETSATRSDGTDGNNDTDDKLTKIKSLFESENFHDQKMLEEIARESLTASTSKVLQSYDNEIQELMEKIRQMKQLNELKNLQLKNELPDLSLLNNNNVRIISRWTNDEILLMTQAVRDYGKDYKIIADIIGTKTEIQIKNYFLQNQDKMKFDTLIDELNGENDLLINDDDHQNHLLPSSMTTTNQQNITNSNNNCNNNQNNSIISDASKQ